LREPGKGHEAIGRLKERSSRVGRYYEITYDAATPAVAWTPPAAKKAQAARLDGGYLLKTDRQDLSDDEIWRLYILLTRVEDAFRDMKSPLMERPIFHHLKHRVQAHIFLCVLAYHLLVAIEKRFLDQGVHTSWATLREQLSTPPGRHGGAAGDERPDVAHPEGLDPGRDPSGDLPHARDPARGHEAGEDLGPHPAAIVTHKRRNLLTYQHSGLGTVEVGLGVVYCIRPPGAGT
jgi:hypothetical protein